MTLLKLGLNYGALKRVAALTVILLMLTMSGCAGNSDSGQSSAVNNTKAQETSGRTVTKTETQTQTSTEAETETETQPQAAKEETAQTEAGTDTEVQEENDMKLNILVGEQQLSATLVDNSSTEALKEMLKEGPLTIEMSDYSNFEKVGSLGTSLPRNDEQITTEPGDLILYQGDSFVIYYDANSWNFTRLGRIDNATKESLLNVLGDGDVTVTLSLGEN